MLCGDDGEVHVRVLVGVPEGRVAATQALHRPARPEHAAAAVGGGGATAISTPL